MDIRCMEPIPTSQVVREEGFIHQMKWDGIRGVVEIKNGSITIHTKSGNDCTASYPEISLIPSQVRASQAVLDGELVVFADGKPSFYHAVKRNRTRNSATIQQIIALYPVRYIVFDILFLNGEDLRQYELEKRQEMLKAHFSDSEVAALTDSFENGEALFSLMKQKNMEGIVSKRLKSKYTAGKKHSDWYKTKTAKKMLCAVMGIRQKHGIPASLVLGIYRDGTLVNVGGVSSGLRESDVSLLAKYLQSETIGTEKDVAWVQPTLTCWVRFSEWTSGGTLRHPVLMGFGRQDVKMAMGDEISV